jgi:hypothetical protein
VVDGVHDVVGTYEGNGLAVGFFDDDWTNAGMVNSLGDGDGDEMPDWNVDSHANGTRAQTSSTEGIMDFSDRTASLVGIEEVKVDAKLEDRPIVGLGVYVGTSDEEGIDEGTGTGGQSLGRKSHIEGVAMDKFDVTDDSPTDVLFGDELGCSHAGAIAHITISVGSFAIADGMADGIKEWKTDVGA